MVCCIEKRSGFYMVQQHQLHCVLTGGLIMPELVLMPVLSAGHLHLMHHA